MRYKEIIKQIEEFAKSIQLEGQEHRFNCPFCGDTRKRLYIKKQHNKILAHCFNGGCVLNKGVVIQDNDYVKKYINNFKFASKTIDNNNNNNNCGDGNFDSLGLTKDIPTPYLKYLLQYLSPGIIEKYNSQGVFLYSRGYDRIAYKCIGGYVLRSLTKKPKYLNLKAKFFVANKQYYNNKNILLTEDILSACKATECLKMMGFALLGINIYPKLLNALICQMMPSQGHIFIWLDNDNAGWLGALKIKKQLNNLNVKIIKHREPKLCSFEEIAEVFNKYKNVL